VEAKLPPTSFVCSKILHLATELAVTAPRRNCVLPLDVIDSIDLTVR
jgi:hypothetical protein